MEAGSLESAARDSESRYSERVESQTLIFQNKMKSKLKEWGKSKGIILHKLLNRETDSVFLQIREQQEREEDRTWQCLTDLVLLKGG